MKHNRGFSLLELMIVMAILAITASFAVPAWISWRDDSKAKSAAASMRGDFERAKHRAIRDNINVRVVFAADSYQTHTDMNGNGAMDGDDELITQKTMAPGVSLTHNFSDDDMSFSSRGIPAGGLSDAGTVTMRSPGGSEYRVVVSRFGRVRTE